MSRVRVSLLVASILLPACGPGPASTSTARDHVVDVFQAIATRDCATVRRLMPSITDQEGCDDLFDDSRGHGLELLDIASAENDGRDPRAVIVRCHVRMEGSERILLVRAEEREAGWAVSM